MELLLLVPLLLILVLPTFLMSRRQRAKMEEIQRLQNALIPGDRVVTTSGQHGTVVSVNDELIQLETAPGVVGTWEKIAVVRTIVADNDTELDDHNTEFSDGSDSHPENR